MMQQCSGAVLVVEDSPADAELVELAVKSAGPDVRVFWVEDGAKALRFLKRERPFGNSPPVDLVLLDLKLPGLDGRQVLTEIRVDSSLRELPVVVFSSSEDYGDVTASYQSGANAFLSKPVDPERFLYSVRTATEFWFNCAKRPLCCRSSGPAGL